MQFTIPFGSNLFIIQIQCKTCKKSNRIYSILKIFYIEIDIFQLFLSKKLKLKPNNLNFIFSLII